MAWEQNGAREQSRAPFAFRQYRRTASNTYWWSGADTVTVAPARDVWKRRGSPESTRVRVSRFQEYAPSDTVSSTANGCRVTTSTYVPAEHPKSRYEVPSGRVTRLYPRCGPCRHCVTKCNSARDRSRAL